MKLNIVITILILGIFCSSAFGSQALKSTFEQGNEHYKQGEFEKAINSYLTILDAGIENAELYYNLGNAYFKLGRLGQSILYYEKAQKLAPRDEDIQHNLRFAQNQIVDKIELPDEGAIINAYKNFIDSFTINEFTTALLIIFYAELMVIILTIFSKNDLLKKVSIYFGIFLLIAILLFGAKFNQHQRKGGVVLTEKLNVMTEPGTASQIAFTVHEGTKIQILEKRGEWYRINFDDRLFGWIKLPDEQGGNILGFI